VIVLVTRDAYNRETTISRQAPRGDLARGRTQQKARTRQALLEAAVDLVREGGPPSIAAAAERAMVSPATAYRYFAGGDALWEEAAFEITEARRTPDSVADAGPDLRDRLDHAVTTLGWHMLDEETPYRLRARAALDLWFRHLADPPSEPVPVREGRRMAWIARVLEPLDGRLPDEQIAQIAAALSLVVGTEALIALRDVARLDTPEAKAAMRRAARWMLEGALADLGVEDLPPTPA